MHRFEAELWLHDGEAGWCFVALPGALSDDVRARAPGARTGFGSVRVQATIGGTTWATSLFPDSARGAYVLPVRKPVRAAEGLEVGDVVSVGLEVV